MAIILPHVKEQLKQIKKIPYEQIKRQSAVIVDIPIGQLSAKDVARCLYITTNAFTELTHKQQVIVKVINDALGDFVKIIDDKDLSREEIISQISALVRDPDSGVIRSLKDDSSPDTESQPPS